MKEYAAMRRGWKLMNLGLKVYPLAQNTKIPLKGTHGWQSATDDQMKFHDYFNDSQQTRPYLNLGVDLFHAGLMVLDVDVNHDSKGTNGQKSFMDYMKDHNYSMPNCTYYEKTPSGGLHLFYRLQQPLDRHTRKTAVLPGVDLLGDFVVIGPSEINGVPYQGNQQLTSLDQIAVAPDWLKDLLIYGNKPKLVNSNTGFANSNVNRSNQNDTFTSRVLIAIATAQIEEGDRNNWLYDRTKELLTICHDPAAVYQLLNDVNQQHATPPLPQREIDSIFKSALNKQMEKMKRKGELA